MNMIRGGESASVMVNKCKYQNNADTMTLSFEAWTLPPTQDSNNCGNLNIMGGIQTHTGQAFTLPEKYLQNVSRTQVLY